jgi:hypothetical protein
MATTARLRNCFLVVLVVVLALVCIYIYSNTTTTKNNYLSRRHDGVAGQVEGEQGRHAGQGLWDRGLEAAELVLAVCFQGRMRVC